MINRPSRNKRGRLILGEGQNEIIKKQTGKGLSVLLLKHFWLRKKKKTWQVETERLW